MTGQCDQQACRDPDVGQRHAVIRLLDTLTDLAQDIEFRIDRRSIAGRAGSKLGGVVFVGGLHMMNDQMPEICRREVIKSGLSGPPAS